MNSTISITHTARLGSAFRKAPSCPRVFILSDSRLFRDGVAALLAGNSGVEVMGTEALSAPPRTVPADILLLDIAGHRALERFGLIQSANAQARVVALGVVDDVDVVLACARLGVCGFVTPGGSAADVVQAVQSAVRGELVCSPRTAGMLLSLAGQQKDETSAQPDQLTEREDEIMLLLEQGLSNKDIALKLGIRDATVKNHVHNILSKLRVGSRVAAVAVRRRTNHTKVTQETGAFFGRM